MIQKLKFFFLSFVLLFPLFFSQPVFALSFDVSVRPSQYAAGSLGTTYCSTNATTFNVSPCVLNPSSGSTAVYGLAWNRSSGNLDFTWLNPPRYYEVQVLIYTTSTVGSTNSNFSSPGVLVGRDLSSTSTTNVFHSIDSTLDYQLVSSTATISLYVTRLTFIGTLGGTADNNANTLYIQGVTGYANEAWLTFSPNVTRAEIVLDRFIAFDVLGNSGVSPDGQAVVDGINSMRQDINSAADRAEQNSANEVEAQNKTTDAINNLSVTLTDSNISADTDGLASSVSGLLPAGPIDGFFAAVLSFIPSILGGSCSSPQLPLPFVNRNLPLPCGSVFWGSIPALGVVLVIINGGVLYACARALYLTFSNLQKPDYADEEVLDL